MTEIDHAEDTDGAQPNQTDQLIELGRSTFELFHDEQTRAFAAQAGNVFALSHPEAHRRLQRVYKDRCGRYPNKVAVTNAIYALSAEAINEGPQKPVRVRVAQVGGNVVLELGDSEGAVVGVASSGWAIHADVTAPFLLRARAAALPQPVRGSGIDQLRGLVNVDNDQDFMLIVAWLQMALNPVGPYPVLILQGGPGSGKSTLTRMLKSLVDPTTPLIRALPRNLQDLAIAAASNWILALDNLSGLPTQMSDGLCRLSTGGGFGSRTLYVGDDETVFDQTRPIILNGLDGVATRQDLLDRAIVVRLPEITGFKDEETVWAEFEELRPQILGALLDGVAAALAGSADGQDVGAHRMADFVRWASAGCSAYGWTVEELVDAYSENHDYTLRSSLDGSVLAQVLIRTLELRADAPDPDDRILEGTPTKVLAEVALRRTDDELRSRNWPATAQVFSRHLTLMAAALREEGVIVEDGHLGRGKDKVRWLTIRLMRDGDAGDAGSEETS